MSEPVEDLLLRPFTPATPAMAATPATRPLLIARAAPSVELLREAEAQRALAELFPHLKLDALRAIQELFPLHARALQGTPAAPWIH